MKLAKVIVPALVGWSACAHALVIDATFDSSVTSNANALAIETAFNSAAQVYQNLFTNNVTVSVNVSLTNTGLASSFTSGTTVGYSAYRTALSQTTTTTIGATALSHLPTGPISPVNGNSLVSITSANAKALGFDLGANSGYDGAISFNINQPFQFTRAANGTISSGNYDFISAAQHEIDHVLGFTSALDGGQAGNAIPNFVTPMDLYRYDQNGQRSFNFNSTTQAYFSVDGTVDTNAMTGSARFDQNSNGDFSDWFSDTAPTGRPARVQDAFLYKGYTANLGPAEITGLEAIGFNVAAAPVPVPAAFWLFSSALLILPGLDGWRRRLRLP